MSVKLFTNNLSALRVILASSRLKKVAPHVH